MPATRREMERAYYAFKGTKECKYCHGQIEWWRTTRGNFLALNPPSTQNAMDEETERHDCREKSAPAPKPEVTHRRELTLAEEQTRAMDLLASQLQARALVAVMPDGSSIVSKKRGINPEDLRCDIITAANNMRRDLEASQ
jgi:hypothetical protein